MDFASDVCYTLFVTNELNDWRQTVGELYRSVMEREKGRAYGNVL